MSGWTVTTRTYDLSTEVDSDDVTRTDHADTDTVAQREPVTSFDGPTGWAPADVPPQPCPCPPCLAARSLDLGGYDREPCAYTPEGFALERIRIGAHAAPAAPVAVLFVDPRGPYPALGVDWYDAARDARSYQGSAPVVAHPPCGPWGRLRHMSRHDDPDHALWAVDLVRRVGGVLEHPAHSRLWEAKHLPRPGAGPDVWGGYSIEVCQVDWGHVARKRTWLYIVGCSELELPAMPAPGREPTHWITGGAGRTGKKRKTTPVPAGIRVCSAQQRRRTPVDFARWLIDIATRCARAPASRRNVYAAIRASGRVVDVVAIARCACHRVLTVEHRHAEHMSDGVAVLELYTCRGAGGCGNTRARELPGPVAGCACPGCEDARAERREYAAIRRADDRGVGEGFAAVRAARSRRLLEAFRAGLGEFRTEPGDPGFEELQQLRGRGERRSA